MAHVERRRRLVEQHASRGLSRSARTPACTGMRAMWSALLLAARQRTDDARAQMRRLGRAQRCIGLAVDENAAPLARAHAHHFLDGEGKRHLHVLRRARARRSASSRGR